MADRFLRARTPWLLLAGGLVVALIAVAFLSSFDFQVCVDTEAQGRAHQQPEHSGFLVQAGQIVQAWVSCTFFALDKNREMFIALGTVAAAIFGGLLFWATVGLKNATLNLATSTEGLRTAERETAAEQRRANELAERQLDLAEKQFAMTGRQVDLTEKQHGLAWEQFVASHPPKVRVRYLSVVSTGKELPITVKFTLQNEGGSRAKITRCAVLTESMDAHPLLTPPNLTAVRDAEAPEALGVGDKGEVKVECGYTKASLIVEYRNGRLLHVHGLIEYEDIVGGKHVTAFCQSYDPSVSAFTGAGGKDYNYEN